MTNFKTGALLVLLCCVAACKKDTVAPTPAPTPSNVHLTQGLLAYYPFNGNTNDESGNNNNGTLTGGSTLSYDEHGKPLSALNCTGNGQKLVAVNSGNIKLDTAMSVSFNIMTRGTGRASYIGFTEH